MASIDLNNTLQSFLRTWQGYEASQELPKAYLPLALKLLYGDEELVRRIIGLLVSNIAAWADKHSPVYKIKSIVDKSHLENKKDWYVPCMESQSALMATSGTTTGHQFAYRRWEPALRPIEVVNHYKMILQEFNLEHKPKVMYMLANIKKNGNVIEVFQGSPNFTEQHGADEAEVHFVEKTQLYYDNQDKYFDIILDHLCNNPVDVILTSGVGINSLVYHLKRTGIRKHFAKLLSNTADMLIFDDVEWLQDNGIVTHVCDHMRCWDGGASFFTCNMGRYHLMDNLAYCYSNDRRLISTDYFSLPSPFVNYWNGDCCLIDETYKRCECGRLYRPFQFLQNRPFSLKGMTIARWQEQIEAEGIEGIKHVHCDVNNIEVVTSKELTPCDQEKLKTIMRGFLVTFRMG